MSYYLNAEALRVVEKNDRGNVTYRQRYKFGDKVDVSHIDDAQVKNLVNAGRLVQSTDELRGAQSAGATSPTGDLVGAGTAPSGEGPEAEDTESPSDEDEHEVDEYDAMDYAELQQEAKSRELNAGGSAQDLRARLREDDESEDDE